MIYDTAERRIWCPDCERDIEAFDAFALLVQGYHQAVTAVERRAEAISQVEKFKIRSIAAKKLDEAWRQRNMVPCCPHCKNGLLPEDFKRGVSMLGKDWVEARRRGEV